MTSDVREVKNGGKMQKLTLTYHVRPVSKSKPLHTLTYDLGGRWRSKRSYGVKYNI